MYSAYFKANPDLLLLFSIDSYLIHAILILYNEIENKSLLDFPNMGSHKPNHHYKHISKSYLPMNPMYNLYKPSIAVNINSLKQNM